MKNNIKILLLLVMVSVFSCDENEQPYYDGNVNASRTFVSFAKTSYNLPVVIDDTGSVDIVISVSTLSASDRTYMLTLDTEKTTADLSTFVLPSSITVPANSYQGTATIVGMDNDLVEPEAEKIVFNVSGLNDTEDIDKPEVTVNIFEICPVPDDYLVGEYALVDSNGNLGDENVTITVGGDSTIRTFVATFLPGSSVERPTTVVLNLVCNSFIIDDIDENVTCQQGGPGFIFGSAGANNSNYSLDDDLMVTVNYTEDVLLSCGASSIQNFTLTKL